MIKLQEEDANERKEQEEREEEADKNGDMEEIKNE